MRDAFDALYLCILSSILICSVHSGSLSGLNLRALHPLPENETDIGRNVGLTESLTKRSPDLDPINQDIHILWDKEPAGPYDPESHGVYVLFDKDEIADTRAKRSLYSILRGKQYRKKAESNSVKKPTSTGIRRSLFNIVRNMARKKKESAAEKPVLKPLSVEPLQPDASELDPIENSLPSDDSLSNTDNVTADIVDDSSETVPSEGGEKKEDSNEVGSEVQPRIRTRKFRNGKPSIISTDGC